MNRNDQEYLRFGSVSAIIMGGGMSLEHSTGFYISFEEGKNVLLSIEHDRYIKLLTELGIGYPELRCKISSMWLAPVKR